MVTLNREELKADMVTQSAVRDEQNRVLIPARTVLTDRHLRALKMRGIAAVDIQDDGSLTGNADKMPTLSDVERQEILERARHLYGYNTALFQDGLVKQLVALTVHSMTKQMRGLSKSFAHDGENSRDQMEHLCSPSDALPTVDSRDLTLKDIVSRTKDIASLPSIYQEVMEVVNHPHSSMQDVAKVISADTGLTARLLKIVNSTFYSFPAKVDTVSRALTLIGVNELSEMVLATSVMGQFNKILGDKLNLKLFWSHSIVCGVIARELAGKRRSPNTERYFVMGLLHDLGRLVLIAQTPDLVQEAARMAREEKMPLHLAERKVMGFNHADVSRALLTEWNLPESVRLSTGRHHRGQEFEDYRDESLVVYWANVLSLVTGLGFSGEELIPPIEPSLWEAVNVPTHLIASLATDAETQLDNLASTFGLDEGS